MNLNEMTEEEINKRIAELEAQKAEIRKKEKKAEIKRRTSFKADFQKMKVALGDFNKKYNTPLRLSVKGYADATFKLDAADVTAGYVTFDITPWSIPTGECISFYKMKASYAGSDLEKRYERASSAATPTKFYYDSINNRIYFPTDSNIFKVGTGIEIIYETTIALS